MRTSLLPLLSVMALVEARLVTRVWVVVHNLFVRKDSSWRFWTVVDCSRLCWQACLPPYGTNQDRSLSHGKRLSPFWMVRPRETVMENKVGVEYDMR